MMMLDVCPPGDADHKTWIDALETTTRWAKRGMNHYRKTEPLYGHQQILLPIIQGGTNPELRKRSAGELIELDADAYAIGGLAVGESKPELLDISDTPSFDYRGYQGFYGSIGYAFDDIN